jgi:gelsolin
LKRRQSSGDSYILLATTSKGASREWAIHFWLGAETTADEAGTAAYKAVELDEALGGGASLSGAWVCR